MWLVYLAISYSLLRHIISSVIGYLPRYPLYQSLELQFHSYRSTYCLHLSTCSSFPLKEKGAEKQACVHAWTLVGTMGYLFAPGLPRLYTKPKLVTFMIHPMLKIDVFVQSTVRKMYFSSRSDDEERMMRETQDKPYICMHAQ